MAMSLEDLMTKFSLGETAMIVVRMLSGDELPVRIRMTDRVSLFPKQFVDQHKFNPWITHRLRFYANEDWDEDTPLSGFVSVHRFNGSWIDLYRSEHSLPSPLHLVVMDDEEEERDRKLQLLRTIIQSKGLTYPAEDAQLYGDYLFWHLYYRPSDPSFYFIKPNRYETLNTFVQHYYQLAPSHNTNDDENMIMT